MELDQALPVTLSAFTAENTASGLLLLWRTESETNNVGFNIYRSDAKDDPFSHIGWVEGAGSTTLAHEYRFIDQTAEQNQTYFYYIEDVDVIGNRRQSPVFTVKEQPVIPLRIEATVSSRSVIVSWKGRVGPLSLYRADKVNGPYREIAKVDSGSYQDNDLIDGQTYHYFVQGNDDGRSIRSEIVSIDAELEEILRTTFARVKKTTLYQNYPNPFNPETWIPYQLANDTAVIIRIYDVTGILVRQLLLGRKPAGLYLNRNRAAYWDGRSDKGERVASGLYFYHLLAGDYSAQKRMVILK